MPYVCIFQLPSKAPCVKPEGLLSYWLWGMYTSNKLFFSFFYRKVLLLSLFSNDNFCRWNTLDWHGFFLWNTLNMNITVSSVHGFCWYFCWDCGHLRSKPEDKRIFCSFFPLSLTPIFHSAAMEYAFLSQDCPEIKK